MKDFTIRADSIHKCTTVTYRVTFENGDKIVVPTYGGHGVAGHATGCKVEIQKWLNDDPSEGEIGEPMTYVDVSLRGYGAKADGTIDRRTRPGLITSADLAFKKDLGLALVRAAGDEDAVRDIADAY